MRLTFEAALREMGLQRVFMIFVPVDGVASSSEIPFNSLLLELLDAAAFTEWHPENNALLGGVKVKPGSSRRVMWSCPNCPARYPHIWKTTVNKRAEGTKCPYCHGRSLCQQNSLATKTSSQVRYWNHDKNDKTPEQTLAGSHLRGEWKCPTCSHEWQAQIAQRVRDDCGCPRCKKMASYGNRYKQPTFEAAQHPLLLEWDYERNAADGIHPDNTTLGTKVGALGLPQMPQGTAALVPNDA